MRQLLRSYRWRRRIAWGAGSVVVVAVVATLIVMLPNESPRQIDLGPPITGTETVETVPAEVRVTASERRAVNRTLVAFIATAVTRDDPPAAWNLVTHAMRAGVTRREWNRGDLPVVPYPVVVPKHPDWEIVTSYPGDLTIDLILQPKPGSGRPAVSFSIELKRVRDGRWLIDSIVPQDFFAVAPSKPTKVKPLAPNFKPEYPQGRLDPLWIAVPLGILALIVVVPLAIFLVSWRRQRASERRYREQLRA